MASVFETLNSVNVNEHVEKKNGLSYLSWAWAWAELKKRFPGAVYEVVKHDGLPYVYDQNTGYMVFTRLTIEGTTHEMWLPVMDSTNAAMKSEPYTIKTKYGEKHVAAATMFDINRAIMRCLTKNISVFGLGLYIYAGEDLPESETPSQTPTGARISDESAEAVRNLIKKGVITYEGLEKRYGVYMVERLTEQQAQEIFAGVKAAIEKKRKERTETA